MLQKTFQAIFKSLRSTCFNRDETLPCKIYLIGNHDSNTIPQVRMNSSTLKTIPLNGYSFEALTELTQYEIILI
jgi:hypothetical protein